MAFRRIFALLGACLLLVLSSCSSGQDASDSSSAPGEKKVIGVSVLTLANPFFKVIADNIEATVEPEGYEVIVVDAQEDSAKQHDQVKDFIAQGCVAIVLTPKDAEAIAEAIREANNAGIPVFTCDTGCTDETVEVAAHVATDNYQGGRMAAQAMIEALGGHGKVGILHYPTTESCQDRVQGFMDELNDQQEDNSSIDIVVIDWVNGEGKKEVSERVTRDLLQTHDDLVGLFCINDPSALGAVAALEQAGKLDNVVVVGFDGQMAGKQAILEGKILADPIQFPDRMGTLTGQNIVDYFNGAEIEARTLIPPELYYQEDAQEDSKLQATW